MGKTFTKTDNNKKVAGNAKKAANAAVKREEENNRIAAAEDREWAAGAKSNSKKADVEAKKAEAAAKKAERDAQLAAEEANARSKPKNTKSASKKTSVVTTPSRGLDLSQLDSDDATSSSSSRKLPDLNASGIDNALDALDITGSSTATEAGKIDRHPERRFKAAYSVFEAKRLPELEGETPGLRRNQRVELIRKEFAKHPDNPFNQASGRFDSTGADLKVIAERERARVEGLLGSS